MFRKKKELTRLERMQQSLAGQVQQASGTVQEILKHLPEQVQQAGGQVQDAMRHVPLDKVGNTLGEIREGASQAAGRAIDSLSHLKVAAPHLDSVGSRLGQIKDTAAHAAGRARDTVSHAKIPSPPALPRLLQRRVAEPEPAATASKLLWLLAGLIAGVALGLLLAPDKGRRTRSLLRDKLNRAGHDLADAGATAAHKASDVGHKAKGVASQLKSKVVPPPPSADDTVVADRVRTALGHQQALQSLPRLNIDSCNGVVTVRGPMVDQANQDGLAAIIRAVPGVTDVRLDLLVDDTNQAETFVG